MATKPIESGVITSTFEDHKKRSPHGSWGIDIASKEKDPVNVVFAYNGIILTYGWSDTFGNRIWIKLTSGLYANYYNIYPHLSSINPKIKIGEKVKEGSFAGIMGNTGLILVNGALVKNEGQIKSPKGRHLHFEIRTNPIITGGSIEPIEISQLYE